MYHNFVTKSGSPLCCFCNLKNVTPYHLLYEYSYMNLSWNQLHDFLSNSLKIPPLTPQSAIASLIIQNEFFLIINHILFIFKFYSYNFRFVGKLDIKYLKTLLYIKLETLSDSKQTATTKKQKYINKWQPIPIT